MKLVNLTPHPVVIYANGVDQPPTRTIESTGSLRLAESAHCDGEIDGVGVYTVRLGAADMPEPQPGVLHIVSMPVAQAYAAWVRDDIVYPYGQVRRADDGTLATGPDARGQIVGCTSLARIV